MLSMADLQTGTANLTTKPASPSEILPDEFPLVIAGQGQRSGPAVGGNPGILVADEQEYSISPSW
jgi:hypothetical protein